MVSHQRPILFVCLQNILGSRAAHDDIGDRRLARLQVQHGHVPNLGDILTTYQQPGKKLQKWKNASKVAIAPWATVLNKEYDSLTRHTRHALDWSSLDRRICGWFV